MVEPIATIPKNVSGGDELVVIKKEDFERFRKWQEEMEDARAKIERGRKEYKEGETSTASSPGDFR